MKAKARRPNKSFTDKQVETKAFAFLEHLGKTAHVGDSCKFAKVSPSTVYKWRDENETFKELWAEAVEQGTDRLEDEAILRATVGVDEPIIYQGEITGTKKRVSDILLMFMLKARRPEKFKDRTETQLTGKDGAPIQPILNVTIAPKKDGEGR